MEYSEAVLLLFELNIPANFTKCLLRKPKSAVISFVLESKQPAQSEEQVNTSNVSKFKQQLVIPAYDSFTTSFNY